MYNKERPLARVSIILCNFAAVKIKEVLSALERFAPLPLQESWDNAGLQLGLTETEVSGALLCLDVNERIVDEAMAARGGVNFKIAQKLGLQNVAFFAQKQVDGIEAGSGVVGELPEAMAADDFIIGVKNAFGVECAMCNELLRRPIKRVAICGGAGDFLLDEAIKNQADAFITGEMHYHQYFGYEQQIQICVIGHYQSEQYTAEIFEEIIQKECPGVKTCIAETCTNPILYI